MLKNSDSISTQENKQEWLTVQEGVSVVKRMANTELTESDIYRHALNHQIRLSIYFQSPILLRKIKKTINKITLKPAGDTLTKKLCMLESSCFENNRNLIFRTKGRYLYSSKRIIDTPLYGHEHVLIQRLLAKSLGLPLPVTGANNVN